MKQVRGSEARVALYSETEYGVPGATGYLIDFVRVGLQATRELIPSNTISGNRQSKKPFQGNEDLTGPLVVEFAPQIAAKLIYHALGKIATNGVVKSITATGATSADTVTIAAPPSGGTQAVATITGGNVSVTDPGAGYEARPAVTAFNGATPVGTSVAHMAFTHTITPDNTLPEGLTVEVDYGATISGTGRYVQYLGNRIASLEFDFPSKGPVMLTANFQGQTETPQSAPHDSLLTDYGHSPFSAFEGTIKEAGTLAANIQSGKVTITNDLDGESYAMTGDGKRACLPEGILKATGSIRALFTDMALVNKAISGTESSLEFILRRGTGDGTAGNEYFSLKLSQLLFEKKTPPIEGAKGVYVELNFQSYEGDAAQVIAVVKNQLPKAVLL